MRRKAKLVVANLATRAKDAVTPANLCQQVRGPTLRDERLDWHHRVSGGAFAPPLPAVTSSYPSELTNNHLPKSVESKNVLFDELAVQAFNAYYDLHTD